MYTLSIDSSSNEYIFIYLNVDGKEHRIKKKIGKKKAQEILLLIDQLLGEYSLTIHNLTAIEVVTGPGSFTGLRVGVTVANTLGMFLGIPINNNKIGVMVYPEYP